MVRKMARRFDPSQPYDSLPPLPPPREAVETIPVLRKEAAARQALGELRFRAVCWRVTHVRFVSCSRVCRLFV